ncbi:MAG: peptidylprolyl isomerase [Robiginitomaculum sp.]
MRSDKIEDLFWPFWTRALFSGVMAFGVLAGCQEKPIADKLNTPTVRLGNTVVAEVGGTKIYLSDIEHEALAKGDLNPGEVLTPTEPAFQNTLDALIDQRLLVLDALSRSLDQSDEVRRRLAIAREKILSNVVVEDLIAEKVTDETVKRMFDEQAALRGNVPQIRARQLIVKTKEKAIELRELIEKESVEKEGDEKESVKKESDEKESDFSRIAKEFSIDNSTRDLGGDLGYFSRNALNKTIADVAFATKKGTISPPFKTKTGWHILMVTNKRKAPQKPFEEIKAEIVEFMTYDEIGKKLKSLRKNSNIQKNLGQIKDHDAGSEIKEK